MKIICDAPGQTCNRLWSYVATISECIVKKKRMMILFYDYTIEDFPNLLHCPFIYFPLYQKWYLHHGNGWNNFKGLTWKATHNTKLDNIYFFFGCFKGWHTRREIEYISKAKKELKRIFTPSIIITKQGNTFINSIKSDFDMIIGVHIRQGDYRTWNNGRFYFSIEQYQGFMAKIQNLYQSKKIAFFISSNEKLSTKDFSEFNCFFQAQTTSPVLDLYTLSLCDKIIGPISTFSRWASFFGEKPLCFLEDVNQDFTEKSFSPIKDFFHFENGKEIYDW